MIKTAVILSARKERDSEIPYPLIPFIDDFNLIDRSISLLRLYGITKIILVVGYKSELFERYGKESDIIIVKNDNYRYTASMASLVCASNYINEDFILVEGDMLCEKSVYEYLITTDKSNCLTIANESGSGDEAMVEIDGDVVIDISKDLHRLNRIDGEMIGLSRFSLNTFKKMLIKWENNENHMMNYEYMFLDITDEYERKFIKYTDLIWSDVDNASDFQRMVLDIYPRLRKKEDPFDKLNIINHLREIFQDDINIENVVVEPIGGMTNKNFKVTIKDRKFVLRIPGNGTEGMINRGIEGGNTILSHKIGISPNIQFINNQTGIKLTDYVDNAETLNKATIQRFDNLDKVVEILHTLHTSNVRFKNDFNVFHELLVYESLLKKSGEKLPEGYLVVRDKIFGFESLLNEYGINVTPCHNDLVPENFIKNTVDNVYLIDWEYSGMNDPMWDIAALFLESDFSDDNKAYFLQRYFGVEEIDNVIWQKITIYEILMDVLWSLWAVIKEKQGDDFGDYASKRFNRAKKKLDTLDFDR